MPRFWVRAQAGKIETVPLPINHLPTPGFDDGPFAIAVVELEEGPRLMANILDCPQTPEALQLDMALEVTFEKLSDAITLPQFRPAT